MNLTVKRSFSSSRHQQEDHSATSITTTSSSSSSFPNFTRNVHRKEHATKRLLRDWKELQINSFPTITAAPLDFNLFEWHCNLLAPSESQYHGCCFHLVLKFKQDYPFSPPMITLVTPVKHHSHAHGNEICLDMLEVATAGQAADGDSVDNDTNHSTSVEANKMYHGWSTAYSVTSILLQLQSFLLDDDEEYKKRFGKVKHAALIEEDVINSLKKGCPGCSHNPEAGKPWPWNPSWPAIRSARAVMMKKQAAKKKLQEERAAAALAAASERTFEAGLMAREVEVVLPKKNSNNSKHKKKQQQQNKKPQQQESTKSQMEKKLKAMAAKASEATTTAAAASPQQATAATATTSSTTSSLVTKFQGSSSAAAADLPYDLLVHIFSFLTTTDIHACASNVCKSWSDAAAAPSLRIHRELTCFLTKAHFEEDTLGIGITLKYTKTTGKLHEVSSSLDLISKTAFYKLGLRQGVWKEPFQYWIPLFLSPQHAAAAYPLFMTSLEEIYFGLVDAKTMEQPHKLAVDLLCKLMSSMIVLIMNDKMHASTKALEGYCHFQRWLIFFIQKHPELAVQVNKTISRAKLTPRWLEKDSVPNFGEFLPLLSVSEYKWTDVAKLIDNESLDRRAFWLTRRFPEYLTPPVNPSPNYEDRRTQDAFETSLVSCRFIMFHKYFLEEVAGRQAASKSLEQIAANYDARYGVASEDMKRRLLDAIQQIKKVSYYLEYYDYLGLEVKDKQTVNAMIRQSIVNMVKKGYNKPTG